MVLPPQKDIELPLLKVIDEAGGQLKAKDAVEQVSRFFPTLTSEDKVRMLPSGTAVEWINRVQWVRQKLVTRGELDKSVRGIWAITSTGKDRLQREWGGWKPGTNRASSAVLDAKLVAQKSLTEGLVADEKDLYDPVLNWLRNNWGKEVIDDGDEYWVKKTAFQSRRGQPGKWSRPDIMSVQVSRFDILPHRSVDVTTFEVKRFADATDVASVYEVASHQRWGHYAYLVAEIPATGSNLPEHVLAEAARFGVGILTIRRIGEKDEFEMDEIQAPKRQEPYPKDLDGVLKDFFYDDTRELRKFRDLLR